MAKKPAALELLPVEGTGNRFLLLDGMRGPVPDNPGGLALALCRAGSGSAFRPDGLLILQRPSPEGAPALVRMVLYNADGSRPEACGNGLRCIARVAVQRRHAPAGEFRIETDAGIRRVRAEAGQGPVTVEMGPAEVAPEPETLRCDALDVELTGTRVSMGNPHFVLGSESWTDDRVARIGAQFATHDAFPEGVNVGFPTGRSDGGLDLRVYERGVGETQACGTGACAAVAAAGLLGQPGQGGLCRVHLRGGPLDVQRDGDGVLWLTGAVSVGG